MSAAVLSSMTGYASASGAAGLVTWVWEIRSVNGKALEIRCRLPQGFERIEAEVRRRIGQGCHRGSVQATLALQRPPSVRVPRLNREGLLALVAALDELAIPATVGPATLDGLLAVPGIIDLTERDDGEALIETLVPSVMATLDRAMEALVAMRRREGEALGGLIGARLDAIRGLVAAAEAAPGRRPEALRDRLVARVTDLAETMPHLDSTRLHAEAVLLAAKADVREELDRLALHVAAAGDLLSGGGPVGRRLDFLAQELAREASTLCAKSNDAALTLIGLDLRTEIDQLREQVQNLE